jgi:hypothetical protein
LSASGAPVSAARLANHRGTAAITVSAGPNRPRGFAPATELSCVRPFIGGIVLPFRGGSVRFRRITPTL